MSVVLVRSATKFIFMTQATQSIETILWRHTFSLGSEKANTAVRVLRVLARVAAGLPRFSQRTTH
jgi:hypothetical protein